MTNQVLPPPLSQRAFKAIRKALLARGERGIIECEIQAKPALTAKLTAGELWEQKNCGHYTVREIKAWLACFGMALEESSEGPRRDPVFANVYADWLEENGEPSAAEKLRVAFPLHLEPLNDHHVPTAGGYG
jgi:hypothetical protein